MLTPCGRVFAVSPSVPYAPGVTEETRTTEREDVNTTERGEKPGSLKTLLDRIQVGVFRIDDPRAGILSYANPAFCRILGFASPEDAVGTNTSETFADPKERAESFARFLADPELRESGLIRWEARRQRVDTGELVDLLITLSITFDEQGAPRRFYGVIEDIGERKRAEKAFRDSEERFRIFFETAAVGMVLTRPDGVVTRVNESFCQLLGYDEERISGKNLRLFLHEENPSGCLVGAGGDPTACDAAATCLCERRFVAKDGRTVWGSVTRTWLADSEGQRHTAVVTVQDVTVRKRMEEGLQRMEKLESLAVLAGGIAHDFNNILTAILGNITLAASFPGVAGPLADRLDLAQRAAMQARELTQQLSNFARGGEPVRRDASIVDIVCETADISLRGARSAYELHVAEDLPALSIDAGQIGRVFSNLFINANQAMLDGGHIDVRIGRAEVKPGEGLPVAPGTYVRIDIEDEGPGIPPAHLDRIFDPYFSTKRAGTGLGLATAYSIVRRHEGHIGVHSPPNEGCTFSVYLPASRAVAAVAEAVDRRPESPSAHGRVLVMDDDPAIREVASSILRQDGFEVDTTLDGQGALDLCAAAIAAGRPYAAVILDLTVPNGLGAAEVVDRLRELDASVAAIVSSGYASAPVMARCRDFGFDAVIEKPYSASEVRAVLRRALEERERGQRATG